MKSKDYVNRYIDRAGILEQQATKLIRDDETTRAEVQNREMSDQVMLLKDRNTLLEKQLEEMNERIKTSYAEDGIISQLRLQAK